MVLDFACVGSAKKEEVKPKAEEKPAAAEKPTEPKKEEPAKKVKLEFRC